MTYEAYNWVLATTILVLIGVIVALTIRNANLDAENEDLADQIASVHSSNIRLRQQQIDIIDAVLPLVEKTDWMTGRWGGKFEQLVALERSRNEQVERVRRHIMSSDAVTGYIDEHGVEGLLPKSVTLGGSA